MADLQLSGLQQSGYKLRFLQAARHLEHALELLGCEVCEDGTGMAYIVAKDGLRIGGPASKMEQAMADAVRSLLREKAAS